MTEFGFFTLCVGLCLSLYGLITGLIGLFKQNLQIAESGRNALVAVNICVIIAALALWGGIFSHDFSIEYVFRYSAVDMPMIYLFTSFWSALEGSHLLWTFILTSIASAALLTVRPRNISYLPPLVIASSIPLIFMLLLNVWESDPLGRQFPVGQYGSGMNALLQNPYMAAHPPSLFIGYCSLLVPFIYGSAALFKGRVTRDWLITVRRWTLAGWAILTVGIFLGGKWAYVELGWAGYWAWDPVENASFMPWLAATAFLHSLLVLDKTAKLPRLTLFLGMLGFTLTFLGTFITRSGVISSVHSFAESNIGPAYLGFVVLLFLFSTALLTLRGHHLVRAEAEDGWRVSKEASLLFTNFFLIFLLALVMVGTLLPLVVEAVRGVRISIQQPFFNAFAPWVGVGLVSILGVGNLLKWKSGHLEAPLCTLGLPALWSLIITAALFIRKDLDVASTIGFFLCIWTMGSLVMDLAFRLRDLRWNGSLLWRFNKPFLGAFVVHIGFLVACMGFLGGYRGVEATTTLNLGESTQFYDYTLRNNGLKTREGSNYTFVIADIEATNSKGDNVTVQPIRSKFTNNEEWLNEIGVHSTFWHDLYLILNSFEFREQQVTLKMNVNPTVKFVWTSLVIMCIGAIIGLLHTFRKRTIDINASGEVRNEDDDVVSRILNQIRPGLAKSTGHLMIALGVLICVFGLSGVALGDGNPPQEALTYESGAQGNEQPEVFVLDPKLLDVGEELRCPTCQGLSIINSDSAQSIAMKKEISRQLAEGKDKEEILAYFRERYGEWILRQPDQNTSLGLLIWLLPISGLALGPLILVFGLSRAKKREQDEEQRMLQEIRDFVATHKRKQ